jgi:transcriptional regulator with XRE-family HTH domain
MSGKPRSLRQAQLALAGQLRAQGRSWAEIAAEFRAVYRVNARVALRQAHGWSQPQAATRWTACWPDDPKTFKNFSYWELWPSGTGHAPSLDTLDRLAQLYECSISDLLADCRDYGARSPRPLKVVAGRDLGQRGHRGGWQAAERAQAPALGPRVGSRPGSGVPSPALHAALEKIREAEIGELAHGAAGTEAGLRLKRRTLLLEASSALAVVAAAPLLEVPRRLAAARGGDPVRTDLAMVSYSAEVVAGLRRLGGTVGPQITLPPAMALRSAMTAMARNAPETVTPAALAVYGDLTQLVGWLLFNLGDSGAARYYYDDARSAAHQAGNADLVTYVLSASSHLAAAHGNTRDAVDHAHAAQQAARSSHSPFAVAYAADVTARAYAAAGQVGRCQAALDREQAALGDIEPQMPRSPWWYFYDRSFYWGTESECALRLGMSVDASDAAGRSLGLPAPVNLHNSALTLAFRAEALIRQGEFEEACSTLADTARLATLNSSRRISRRIDTLRAQLSPAEDTAAVHELDSKLAVFRRARAAGEPA